MSLTLTEHAAEQVKAVAAKNGVEGTPCLRVAIKGGGCSGFAYQLDLCNGPAEGDEVFRCHDVELVCDPKSYLYLIGTEIDYSDKMLGGGFVFNNPNAKASCGCGASFQA